MADEDLAEFLALTACGVRICSGRIGPRILASRFPLPGDIKTSNIITEGFPAVLRRELASTGADEHGEHASLDLMADADEQPNEHARREQRQWATFHATMASLEMIREGGWAR
jgi:hypothetical protein